MTHIIERMESLFKYKGTPELLEAKILTKRLNRSTKCTQRIEKQYFTDNIVFQPGYRTRTRVNSSHSLEASTFRG